MTDVVRRSAEDDASLVRRCLAEDAEAWELLVRRWGPLAWAVIRRAGLEGEDAADVYQTSWLAAVESLPRLRHPERFGAWLARTAHLQSIRLRRAYGISRRVLGRVPVREEDDVLPDREIEALDERRKVADALGAVGERCETLLHLLYWQQPPLAYTEIARRLGVPVGSVGPTRARCLEKLERLLGLEGGES
jgi:RNA polymerase sigma factor (sigma-70 family)